MKLIISEPKKFQNFQRVGWVIYESQDACRAALSKFNGYKVRIALPLSIDFLY